MTQSRPRRVITRPLSTRVPPVYQKKTNPNPNYRYSPKGSHRKSNPYYNSNKIQNSPYLDTYNSKKKPHNIRKNQESTDWISNLNDINFPSQNMNSNPDIAIPPTVALLFPSPTSPVTRTPQTLRKIIDDSGMKILRESPLSARDSYYARDINDDVSDKKQYSSLSRPYSMRYDNTINNNEGSNKTVTTNTAKSERVQRPGEKYYFKLDNLNTNSNLQSQNTQNTPNNEQESRNKLNYQREIDGEKQKRENLEKLFDLSDFNLDKFDNTKTDLNDEQKLNNTNINDFNIDLSVKEEQNTFDIINFHSDNSSNDSKNDACIPNKKLPIKLPSEKMTNQGRNMNNINNISSLNQPPKTDSNQNLDDSTNITPVLPATTQEEIRDITDLLFSPKTTDSRSNSSISENNTIDSETLNNENDSLLLTSDVDSISTDTDAFDEPIFINIFGDMSSFLYPENEKGRQTNSNFTNHERKANNSALSTQKSDSSVRSSSLKSERNSPKSGRKSVTFILPE